LPETCQKLVYSMPTRVASVIKNKGYPINYWAHIAYVALTNNPGTVCIVYLFCRITLCM
jgi:hypothetical protein